MMEVNTIVVHYIHHNGGHYNLLKNFYFHAEGFPTFPPLHLSNIHSCRMTDIKQIYHLTCSVLQQFEAHMRQYSRPSILIWGLFVIHCPHFVVGELKKKPLMLAEACVVSHSNACVAILWYISDSFFFFFFLQACYF